MSWSVNAIGKAEAVKAKLAADLANFSHMAEPEQQAKDNIGAALLALCDGNPNLIVQVEAHGSQWTDKDGKSKNSTAGMKFEVINGFVE